MAQLRSSGSFQLDSGAPGGSGKKAVIEDVQEEEHAPLAGKSRNASLPQQEGWHCDTLDEPMPLGLRLEKTPSLLELIQAKFSEQDLVTLSFLSTIENSNGRRTSRSSPSPKVSGITGKRKALSFEANRIRIGNWEHVSKYTGDLLVKCYYGKRKIIWEILEDGLKSKIEIPWYDIAALKATYPEDGDGTLDVVLSGAPLFYKEINPRPRKHTLWQAVTDFTGSEASIHRRHFLECPRGLLRRNIRKLLQWDPYLKSLSQQPDVIMDPPYFELQQGSVGRASDLVSQETPPGAGEQSHAHTGSEAEQMREPNNRMTMSDLVNPGENHISEQMASGNSSSSHGTLPTEAILQHRCRHLLGNSEGSSLVGKQQFDFPIPVSEIKPQNPSNDDADLVPVTEVVDAPAENDAPDPVPTTEVGGAEQSPPPPQESFGEFLMNLPRIASLPQLSNIF